MSRDTMLQCVAALKEVRGVLKQMESQFSVVADLVNAAEVMIARLSEAAIATPGDVQGELVKAISDILATDRGLDPDARFRALERAAALLARLEGR